MLCYNQILYLDICKCCSGSLQTQAQWKKDVLSLKSKPQPLKELSVVFCTGSTGMIETSVITESQKGLDWKGA